MQTETIQKLKETLAPFSELSKLTKKTANESAGPCPVCGGEDRFFVRGDRGFCRNCNLPGGDIVDWHCLKDGLDMAGLCEKYGIENGNGKLKLVKTYDYVDADGHVIFQVCRMEPKNFRQRRPDGNGGFIWNMKSVERLPYRLPEVIKSNEVLIVEGEKDADALAALGFTATTNPGGAKKWRDSFNQYLAGKRIVIIPDQDEPGENHLLQVSRSLAASGIEPRVVRLPSGVKDASDFIATFQDRETAVERLAVMIDGAEPYTSETGDEPVKSAPSMPPSKEAMRISPADLASARLSPACIVRNYLFADVATLVAPGGTGKTTLQLFEMVCIALSRPLYGLDILWPGWSLYVTAEDSREILTARLREIMQAMGLTDTERQTVIDKIMIWDVTGELRKLIELRDGNIELKPLADNIVDTYRSDPPALMVFDPAISFGVGESVINDNEQGLITAGRRIVRGLGCCVRFIAHTGKANARYKTLDQYTSRGGSALPDGSRMTAVMQSWHPDDERKLPPGLTFSPESSISILARPKLSYSPPNLPLIWIKRTGWAFEYVTEIIISDEEKEKSLFDQVERFLHSEVMAGVHHNKTSLDTAVPGVVRAEARRVINQLIARGRVMEIELPKNEQVKSRKTYLVTSADFGRIYENDGKSQGKSANEMA